MGGMWDREIVRCEGCEIARYRHLWQHWSASHVAHTAVYSDCLQLRSISGPVRGDIGKDPGECWQSILWSHERDSGEKGLRWHAGKIGERKEKEEEMPNPLIPWQRDSFSVNWSHLHFPLKFKASDTVILNNYYLIKIVQQNGWWLLDGHKVQYSNNNPFLEKMCVDPYYNIWTANSYPSVPFNLSCSSAIFYTPLSV